MHYSYVEIEYIATSFSPARTDLTVELLMSELFLATIKFGMASLEVGPEFAANF